MSFGSPPAMLAQTGDLGTELDAFAAPAQAGVALPGEAQARDPLARALPVTTSAEATLTEAMAPVITQPEDAAPPAAAPRLNTASETSRGKGSSPNTPDGGSPPASPATADHSQAIAAGCKAAAPAPASPEPVVAPPESSEPIAGRSAENATLREDDDSAAVPLTGADPGAGSVTPAAQPVPVPTSAPTPNAIAAPATGAPATQPGAADEGAAKEPSDGPTGDRRTIAGTRSAAREPDHASVHRSADKAQNTRGGDDFAHQLRAPAGEPAALPAEGGPVAGDTLQLARSDPARSPAAQAPASAATPHTVSARPGEIGRQLGVEIARHGLDGRDSLTIRLDPVEMGRIQIRLQFDDQGTMRAHVSAESSAALEMLRRDSGDLMRALGDAGVRTDAQSFQFDTRGHSRGDQPTQHDRPQAAGREDAPRAEVESDTDADADALSTRPRLRINGTLDLIA